MSAPLHDPLVVNTQDGRCWRRRAWSQDGRGLYALADCADVFPTLRSIRELAEFGLGSMAFALPMPVGTEPQSTGSYPPALPWAALLDGEDLTDFIDELAAAATTLADSEVVLVEVEKACATWRLIAEAQHAHNTAPGPDAITRRIAPTQALREGETAEPYVSRPLPPRNAVCARPGCGHSGADHHHGDTKCWAHLPRTRDGFGAMSGITICGCSGFVAEPGDGEHYAVVHHDYRPGLGRDLPEAGGV